jgi:rubrerythrin
VAKTESKSVNDAIFLAINREKESFAQLAAAARSCTSPKTRRLYNQLALDELKHILSLVSLLDGLADDWLSDLDLTFPFAEFPEPLPKSEDSLLRLAMKDEEQTQALFSTLAEGVGREELVSLLDMLRSEEEDHLARLRSMLYGLEADRPAMTKWLRSIRRLVPTGYLH